MNTKQLREYKKTLKLNKQQRQIIVGVLLGDGHLETLNDGRTYKLRIEHSLKQRDYVDWLYQQFKDWVLTPPHSKEKTVNGKQYTNYYFNTVSHGAFRFYGQQFYRKQPDKRIDTPNDHRVKVVPKMIQRWLTPLTLAIWFMDDGSSKSKQHRARILNTQGFSTAEIKRLATALERKFALTAKLRKQKEGYQIMIGGESYPQLYQLISPYVLPSMRYKLDASTGQHT